jgi:predicted ferric reductase
MSDIGKRRKRWRLAHLLLLVPYIAVLWVPSFNRAEPSLAGIPFFYWYQMLWIALGAVLLLPVYLAEERDSKSE